MNKIYYKKKKRLPVKRYTRLFGAVLIILGLGTVIYVFFPLISYFVFIAPVFTSDALSAPIPQTTIVNGASVKNMILSTDTPMGTDYNNINNWFPGFSINKSTTSHANVKYYTLTIPSINIKAAQVTTVDTDLSKHLVNIANTAVPPEDGNTVIFGHSTLPWLFDPNNYHTILANALQLKDGDKIIATVDGKSYTYSIYSITVVPPSDTSIFSQIYDTSYITIVTCTPPGTTWQRLIIRARLE